jgi:hypothetical protein
LYPPPTHLVGGLLGLGCGLYNFVLEG